jgi:eukaryotic-like serine/threonine-protein kinase
MPLKPGDKLGPYEILAPIGAGGMGEVYRARDPRLNRDVAIKVSAAQFSERFEREAKAIAALNHSNICQIYDVGPNYLVMEYIEGEAPKGPMPIEGALRIARQIADALEAAHDKGIIHRDLKPANIKVKSDGTVKVLDFGLAKIAAAPAGQGENSPTLTIGMTEAGMILGTASYMAPEQARGKETVDKRADIWAFGVVLYELITGQRLFKGEDVGHTLAAVIMQDPDLSGVPAQVLPLLKRCLEKDPKKRLRDIGDMELLLSHDSGGAEPVASTAPLPERFGKLWPVAAGLLALTAAALAFVHFREQPPERQVLQYTLAPPEKASNVQYLAVSPDGHSVVIQATGEAGQRLWVRSLDSLQTQALAGTDNAAYPFWSPDSRYIAFFAQDKLVKISVNGGPTQALCDAPNSRGGSWGRDNVIVFAPGNGNNGLSRVPAVGGVPVPVTKNEGNGTHRFPLFLPDGRRFLYLANNGANGRKDDGIRLASLDSPEERRLVLDESKPDYLPPSAGHPLGHLLFVRQQTLMAQPVDPQSLEPKGDLFPVAERISRGNSNGNYLSSVAANGLLLFQSGGSAGGNQHVWFDRTGKEAGTVGSTVPSRNSIALSPEGKRVVIERVADQGSDLWITDMEHSGTETRLTFDPSNNSQPVWSPDGSKVAFARDRGGTLNLYQRSSNGTGQDELLFESKETKSPFDWSRDGKFLIFGSLGAKTNVDLWALPMTGAGADKPGDRKPILLLQTPYAESQGQLSPDSRWLAYTSNESGNSQVYVQPFIPGWDKPITGKWQISTAGGTQPRWRGDGKELFYVAPDRKLMAVEVKAAAQSFDRGTPQALFETRTLILAATTFSFGYVPRADGKQFLMPVAAGTLGETPPLTVVVNWLAWVKK